MKINIGKVVKFLVLFIGGILLAFYCESIYLKILGFICIFIASVIFGDPQRMRADIYKERYNIDDDTAHLMAKMDEIKEERERNNRH